MRLSRENRPPEYRARFVRNGSNALFYVEYSMSSPTGWTQPRKIKTFDVERFAAGQIVSFPIAQICQTKEGVRWCIGLPVEDAKEGVLRDMLNSQAHYRGRVTLLTKDNLTQHCYFILATNENSAMPVVTGEHMFSHMFEWEGKTSPNGNYKSLFK
jgi:hypothetical protein